MNTGMQLISNILLTGSTPAIPNIGKDTNAPAEQSFADFMLGIGKGIMPVVEIEQSEVTEQQAFESVIAELFPFLSNEAKGIIEELVELGSNSEEISEEEELSPSHIAQLLFVPVLFQSTEGKNVLTSLQQGKGIDDEQVLKFLAATCEESLTDEKVEALKNLLQAPPKNNKQSRVEYIGQLVQRVIEKVSVDGKVTKEVEVIRPQPFAVTTPMNHIILQQVTVAESVIAELFPLTEGKKVLASLQQGKGIDDEQVLKFLAATCEESLTDEKVEALKNLLQAPPKNNKQSRVEYIGQLVQRVIEKVSVDGKVTKEVEVIRPQPFAVTTPMNDIIPQQAMDTKAFALYVGANTKAMDMGQFIRDFQNILAASNFTNGQSMQKLTIKLYPEHLGSLRIELVKRGDEMVAKIIASSTTTKDMLESQVQQLRTALSSQNISVDKVEISSYLQQWKEDHSREQQEAPEKKEKQEVEGENEQEK